MQPLGRPGMAAGSIPALASCGKTTAMLLRLTQGTCLIYRSWVLLAPLQISDLLAVFNDKLHMFNSSAILFSSFRTLRWIGSSRGDLLQFNLSSCFSTFSCTPLTAVHLHKPKTGISPFSSEWGPPQKLFGELFLLSWPYFFPAPLIKFRDFAVSILCSNPLPPQLCHTIPFISWLIISLIVDTVLPWIFLESLCSTFKCFLLISSLLVTVLFPQSLSTSVSSEVILPEHGWSDAQNARWGFHFPFFLAAQPGFGLPFCFSWLTYIRALYLCRKNNCNKVCRVPGWFPLESSQFVRDFCYLYLGMWPCSWYNWILSNFYYSICHSLLSMWYPNSPLY